MTTLRISGFDHLVLRCADVETTLAWYRDVLGLAGDRVEEWRAGNEPTPWATGLVLTVFAALVVGVAVWVLAAGLSDRPVVAVLVNLLVAGGLAPAIWLSRGAPHQSHRLRNGRSPRLSPKPSTGRWGCAARARAIRCAAARRLDTGGGT